jgi:hypothetical protein
MTLIGGALLGAALGAPAFLGWSGHWPWGLGLWLGEALGVGAFLWIRWSVRSALDPGMGTGSKNPWGLLGHSLARLLVLGLVFFWVLKNPAVSIWAVLSGYMLVQLLATVWQRWVFQGKKRSFTHERDS